MNPIQAEQAGELTFFLWMENKTTTTTISRKCKIWNFTPSRECNRIKILKQNVKIKMLNNRSHVRSEQRGGETEFNAISCVIVNIQFIEKGQTIVLIRFLKLLFFSTSYSFFSLASSTFPPLFLFRAARRLELSSRVPYLLHTTQPFAFKKKFPDM